METLRAKLATSAATVEALKHGILIVRNKIIQVFLFNDTYCGILIVRNTVIQVFHSISLLGHMHTRKEEKEKNGNTALHMHTCSKHVQSRGPEARYQKNTFLKKNIKKSKKEMQKSSSTA